jgi:hypothetical protein
MGVVLTSNIVILASEAPPAQALTFGYAPRIGWRDVWATGTLAASSEAQPKELAVNGLTYDGWRSSTGSSHWISVTTAAGPINYVAVAAVNLAGGQIKPQYYDGSTWVDLGTATAGDGSKPIVWYFPEQNASAYRLLISNAGGAVTIGVVMAGIAMVPDSGLPVGWEPPSINPRNEYSNDISVNGQMLGRQLRRYGAVADVTLEGLTYTWARGEWSEFLTHAYRKGFFLWWEYASKAEVIYGGMTSVSGSFTQPEIIQTGFRMEGVAV